MCVRWILLVILCTSITESLSYKRVCYFTNWAQYRGSPATFTAANIDANLCTHIMYAFAQMDGNGLATYEWNDETQYGVVMSKKTENPNLKVMLAVGGYTHGVDRFSAMVSSLSNIEEFADNAITFLRYYNFDGLDLDWEYPAHRGSPSGDREKFTQLTMVLREKFDIDGSTNNRPALLLSTAVSAARETADTAYEIGLISQYVDFINLMTYDFHGTWDVTAGHNSPLYERVGETGNELHKNQNAGVRHWLSSGTPPVKLVMGLALYGRSFTLGSSSDTTMGSAIIGAGTMGTYTVEAGYLGYFEICDRIENGRWTKMWHNEHQVPYAYNGNQWVGFDDVQSFTIKAEYIKSMGLGGSMVWAMDLDDFSNRCGFGVNPMMTSLKTVFETSSTVSTISQQPVTTTEGIPSTTNMLTSTTGELETIPTTSASIQNSIYSSTTIKSQTSSTSSTGTTETNQPSSEHTATATTNMSATSISTSSTREHTMEMTQPTSEHTATATTNMPATSISTSSTPSTSEHTMEMTQPTSEQTTTRSTSDNVNTTMSALPTFHQATSTTSSANNCELTVCPAGLVVPSLCDPSCVFQCCSEGNIQHCCQAGYTWNDSERKCQMTGSTTATTSNNIPNCDVPSSCIHGEFTADQCNPQCYYNCAHGTAFHVCCAAGTLWDDFIKDCNHPHLIQYDPACHHSVCPANEFLPDPCVPDCYYQCSSTGVDFRYCCSAGLLWDVSIKNCNYPAAIPPTSTAQTTASGQATTSSPNGGQSNGTATFHSIIFSNCSAPVTTQTGPTTIPTASMTSPASTTDVPTISSTSTSSNCEPSLCVAGQLVPSLCDPSCVFQCCSEGNIQHCCQSGYTWNDAEENCQMTVPVTTTTSNSIPSCDVPSSCIHGEFIADQCDPQCYYNCAHDTAFHVCCAAGTLWDDFIKNCNHPHLIQYDPACHHSVCPANQFLPDPCVPDCYYQCSSTGVDFRYCCSAGLLWDVSIKNCNYPAAIPPTATAQTTSSDQATTSPHTGGKSSVTVVIHHINFTKCRSTSALSTSTPIPSSSSTRPTALVSSSFISTTTTTTPQSTTATTTRLTTTTTALQTTTITTTPQPTTTITAPHTTTKTTTPQTTTTTTTPQTTTTTTTQQTTTTTTTPQTTTTTTTPQPTTTTTTPQTTTTTTTPQTTTTTTTPQTTTITMAQQSTTKTTLQTTTTTPTTTTTTTPQTTTTTTTPPPTTTTTTTSQTTTTTTPQSTTTTTAPQTTTTTTTTAQTATTTTTPHTTTTPQAPQSTTTTMAPQTTTTTTTTAQTATTTTTPHTTTTPQAPQSTTTTMAPPSTTTTTAPQTTTTTTARQSTTTTTTPQTTTTTMAPQITTTTTTTAPQATTTTTPQSATTTTRPQLTTTRTSTPQTTVSSSSNLDTETKSTESSQASRSSSCDSGLCDTESFGNNRDEYIHLSGRGRRICPVLYLWYCRNVVVKTIV